MQQKKTTLEEYQKCVNAVIDYINQHLGEEIDLKLLAGISHFSPYYFHRIMKAFLGEPVGTFVGRYAHSFFEPNAKCFVFDFDIQ